MDVAVKLRILADAAKYDASCASSGVRRRGGTDGLGSATGSGICHSYTPDGRCVSLLKILLTNRCIYECRYCINRASSDVERARFTVQEVVDLTIGFYRRNYIEGLFLSSGIMRSPDATMDELAEVARKLREEHRFRGYIHLKAVAGASEEAIARAGVYADRLSANIELPTEPDLQRLAPEKRMAETDAAMAQIRRRIDEQPARSPTRRFAPAGQSTQMIVGATATPDRAILQAADRLYRGHRLRRVYYTSYSPIPEGHHALPAHRPPLAREHRLYQADWLLRFYGFDVQELAVGGDGNLDLDVDPKTAWAVANRQRFPVDPNTADREALLRVPGLGVRTVHRLLIARRHRAITRQDLAKLRVPLRRAMPFLDLPGERSAQRCLDAADLRQRLAPRQMQLSLFETVGGEL